MVKISDKEVYTTATKTKKIHRIGTDVYFTRCTKLPNDTLDDFEEIDIENVPQIEEPLEIEE